MNWNVVEHLVQDCGFGQQKRLAAAVGVRESVVSDWRRKNVIPSDRQPLIIRAAREMGLVVLPEDFFPPELRGRAAPADEAAQ